MNSDYLDIDTLSGMSPIREAVFSLGSNLGDRFAYLQGAVNHLRTTPGLVITRISSVYQTTPVGLVDQPDFLNLVVTADTSLASTVLLERALAIEEVFDRVREVPGGPRTVDVDLIAVDDREIANDFLTLPHPRAHERAFVLVPWHEINPAATLVGYGPIGELLEKLDRAGVQRQDDLRVE